jgi:hypothetical protein
MNLELEPREASLLFRVVRNRFVELRQEVRHTKDSEVRAYLQHKGRLLGRVMEKMQGIDEHAHMEGFLQPTTEG